MKGLLNSSSNNLSVCGSWRFYMKKRYLMLLFLIAYVLLFQGCITTKAESRKGFTEALDSWIGHDVNEWIDSRGYPQRSFVAPNGNKGYVWIDSQEVTHKRLSYEQGTTTRHNYHGSSYRTDSEGTTSTTTGSMYGTSTIPGRWGTKEYISKYWCHIYLEVENNIIVNYRAEGNNCY